MDERRKRDEIEELEERLGDLYSMTSDEYRDLEWWLAKKAACAVLLIALLGSLIYLLA